MCTSNRLTVGKNIDFGPPVSTILGRQRNLLAFPSLRFSVALSRNVIGWLVIASISILVFLQVGTPSGAIVITAFAAFLVGVLLGVAWTIEASRSQWPFVEQHINFESIEARLRELGT